MPSDGLVWPQTLHLKSGKFPQPSRSFFAQMLKIYREKEHSQFARVLYSGYPVQTIHGPLDWLPLSQLINIMNPYVPENITSLCG